LHLGKVSPRRAASPAGLTFLKEDPRPKHTPGSETVNPCVEASKLLCQGAFLDLYQREEEPVDLLQRKVFAKICYAIVKLSDSVSFDSCIDPGSVHTQNPINLRRALSCSLAESCLTEILGRRISDFARPLGSAASFQKCG